MRIHRGGITKEERAAKKIHEAVMDISLDLEKLGYYLTVVLPYLHFNRVMEIMESAQYQHSGQHELRGDYYVSANINRS